VAVREIYLDALREQRIGIRVTILNDLQTVGEGERLRIGKCLGSEVLKADRATAQTYGADVWQTEPSVIGRHRLRNRAAD